MCGIAGIYNRDGAPVPASDISRMLERLVHRGPDDEGLWSGEGIGLGHRRLSIIDVTAAGHQPMPTADGNVWITYNGELYNYKEIRQSLEALGRHFRSESDTEVILQAYQQWGTRCLQEFNGMFAFALWDSRERRLFCARDRVGIKPLYYVQTGQRLAFASEVKALLTLPGVRAEPDAAALIDYLTFAYARGPRTLFRGISKLLPGEMLLADAKGVSVSSYWDVAFDETDRRPESAIVEELTWLIDDAVRIQMRADVPVGTHLSGGLDSSLVTTLARRHHPGTLLSFNGRFAEGPEYDESRYARTLAESAGVELVDVLVDQSDFLPNLARLAWHMDEPTAGPGLYPQYFVCRAARSQVTVALGGQGGDEVFVGYPRYRDHVSRHQVLSLLRGKRPLPGYPARQSISNMLRADGVRAIAKLVLTRLDPLLSPTAVAHALESTARAWNVAISAPELRAIRDAELARPDPQDRCPLGRLLYHDFKNYLPALLHVEDRTSMAVSLESRVPLLDHRIVELLGHVPSAVKFPPFRFKHLLRKVAEPILPESIVNRKDKKGFPTPLLLWVDRQRNDPALGELLSGTSLQRVGMLRGSPVAPGQDAARCWAALSLELWARLFVEGVPVAQSPSLRKAS